MASLIFAVDANTLLDTPTASGLETLANAQFAALLSDIVTGVSFTTDDQSRTSRDLRLTVTYTDGAAAISTPFLVKAFTGRTVADVAAAANAFTAAHTTYFFSGLFTQVLTNTARRSTIVYGLIVYNTSLTDGASHYAGSGAGGGGGGTVGGSGTAGKLAVWTSGTDIGDSALTEATNTITSSKELITLATAAARAGFNLPHGTAPSAPVNGDLWTTTAGLFARINGATVTYGSGTIGGTAVLNRVAYGSGANTLQSSANLTYNGTTLSVAAGGRMGVGSAGLTSNGLTLSMIGTLSTADQSGLNVFVTGSVAATATVTGVVSGAGTATSATTADVMAFWALPITPGSGSTITRGTGIHISDPTAGTNRAWLSLGTSVSVPSYVGNFAIYSDIAQPSSFAGTIAILDTTTTSFTTAGGGSFAKLLQTVASASGSAGFNLPHGAAPSAPVNGDLWTTTTALFVRINGATVQLGGGGLTGSLTATRVPFASGASTLTDSAFMTFSTAAGLVVNRSGAANVTMLGSNAGNTTMTAVDCVLIGDNAGNAITSGAQCTFLGKDAGLANTQGSGNTFIGFSAGVLNGTSGARSGITAVGYNAGSMSTGGSNTFLGATSGANSVTGTANIFIGRSSGDGTGTAASNRFVAGSDSYPVADVWFGQGETNAAAVAWTLHGTNGAGADKVGGALQLAGGQGTGTGVGGNIVFQTAIAGGSSSTLNALTTGLTINQRKTADFAYGLVLPVRTVTATTDTATYTDYTIQCDTTSNNIAQTLPASPPTGLVINVKKTAAGNTLTITASAGNIDGAASVVVTTLNQSYSFQYNGTQWIIL